MRIVHCSDLHLDRPFAGLDREAARRRRLDLRAALERILALATERGAGLLTVGGDLWEDEHVTADTRRFVAHLLGGAGVPVLIAPGNHDPFLPGGHYARTEWPPNVFVFQREHPEERRFGEVSVWGVGWSGGSLDLGWLDAFRTPADGRAHILLVHGSATRRRPATRSEDQERYAPFGPALPARCGFALCLAGHYHDGWHQDGVVYPGSPEPLGPGETGRHTAALIDTAIPGIPVELVDINRLRFVERQVDCEGAASSADVAGRVAASVDLPAPETTCVRVELVGQIGTECQVDPDALAELHRERFAALEVRDLTVPAFDYEALAARADATGFFVRTLRGMAESADDPREREKIRVALDAGLHALDGRGQVARVD